MISLALLALISVPDDKLAHAGVSMGLTVGTYAICRGVLDQPKLTCTVAAAVTSLALGTAKEVMDGNKNTRNEHIKDLTADAIGTGLGLVFTIPF